MAKFSECDRVIGINGEEIGHVPNIVALNDFAAGHLAAEKLLEAGCINPAIIYSRWRCRPFDERRNGFVAALQENGIDAANAVYGEKWEGQGYSTTENLALAAQVLKDGHDGLFLFTDELSQIICDYLHEQRRMPDDFKFITLDSTGFCREGDAPIAAITHGTEGIVQNLENILVAMIQHQPYQKITLVEPEFLPGATI